MSHSSRLTISQTSMRAAPGSVSPGRAVAVELTVRSVGFICACLRASAPHLNAGMTAEQAVVEEKGKRRGKKPDHGKQDQRRGLVNCGMFEVAVVGDGTKHFSIDSQTAATELMNEPRRDRAEIEIGGVEV